jgi:hypothetical protein
MEKVLAYDRSIVAQETGYWCGPAATQVVLNGPQERHVCRDCRLRADRGESERKFGLSGMPRTPSASLDRILLHRWNILQPIEISTCSPRRRPRHWGFCATIYHLCLN